MSAWALLRDRARTAETAVAATAVLLSAACLAPLFRDWAWAPPVVAVVLVVALLGALSRAIGMPLPLVPVVEGLGLLLALTAMTAGSVAWAHVVPTSPAWDVIRAILAQGMADSQRYAAPVPTWPGVLLLATGGVGLVALWVDTLVVSVRAVLLGGIGLAALYLAPASMLVAGAPWWAVALPALGWLLILAADQRDRVRTWAGLTPRVRVRGLARGAWRAGAVVIVLATLVTVLLPLRFVSPWRHAGAGPGGAPVTATDVVLDPIVSLRRDLVEGTDTEVLSYRTPAANPSYLRVSVLEDFDGVTWRPRAGLDSGSDDGISLPTGTSALAPGLAGTTFPYDITVVNLENGYLPLPYPLVGVSDIAGLDRDWHLDPATAVAFSDELPATGLAYRAIAREPGIRSEQLRAATDPKSDFRPQLALPSGLDPMVARLARAVTGRASTPYDQAVALQTWFTRDGDFRYSTDVRSGADADYITEFLTDRVGYCEQFAASMAVMARTLGIPSRVVVGFTQGTRDEDGVWHVTVRDAHAWPELWFDGVGWARFEPTPRSDGTVLTPDYARSTQPSVDDRRNLDRRLNPADDVAVPGSAPAQPSRPDIPWLPVLVLTAVLSLIALGVPMVRRRWRRHQRRHARGFSAAVVGAWAELADLAVDLGQPWSETSTPRQADERLARGMSEPAARALRRLRGELEEVRYGRPGLDGAGERADAVRADLTVVERELRGRVRWQIRLRAYCWPPSERRRQRSSMRSMKPGDFVGRGVAEPAGAAASSVAGRAPKAE
jgi:transglutaminase-like putative cysteine protease